MRLLPSGSHGLLLELEDTPTSLRWYEELERARERGLLPEVSDLVPAARTVLLALHGGADPAALAPRLRALTPGPRAASSAAGDPVQIPVHYDGPDLEHAATALGIEVSTLIERHQSERWSVAFCGFAPGFGYLTGEVHDWQVPRRPEPRSAVPAGSVALAGPYTGVYPRSSPGGWLLIGRTELSVFDLAASPPALLAPGTRVSFVALDMQDRP